MEHNNKAEEIKQELQNNVLKIAEHFTNKPEDIIQYLKFKDNFYNYSSRNSLLIYQQNPGAVFCNSYKAFENLGYKVKKGQHGMKILVPTMKTYLKTGDTLTPLSNASKQQKEAYKQKQIESFQKLFFKVGTVFDITQTNCPKSDYPKYLDIGYSSEQHAELYKELKKFCSNELNCPVKENNLNSVTLRGYFSPAENLISISGAFDDTTKLSILTHETAHAIMHGAKNLNKTEAQIEFEADATSIMLHNHFGLTVTDSRQRHICNALKEMKTSPNFKLEMITKGLEQSHEAFKKILSGIKNEMLPEHTHQSRMVTEQISTTGNLATVLPNQIPTHNMGGFSQSMN